MVEPTKEQIREWQKQRLAERSAPPDGKEIRRKLGWNLADAMRKIRDKLIK